MKLRTLQIVLLSAVTAATMSAVDRYGFEMIAQGPSGRTAVRLGFPEPCTTGDAVRKAGGA